MNVIASTKSTRVCGECTRCCYHTEVNEYDSVSNEWCKHCNVGVGCNIYKDIVTACSTYKCMWLADENIPESLRPDRCHIIFELPYGCETFIAHEDPDFSDAYKEPNVLGLIRKINDIGSSVVIIQGKTGDNKIYSLGVGKTKEELQRDINANFSKARNK